MPISSMHTRINVYTRTCIYPQGYAIQLDKTKEGVLDSIIFLGMMVGGYLWGSLSDQVGRRSCLITSLTVNGVFGLASAFSPNYPVFLVFRVLQWSGGE